MGPKFPVTRCNKNFLKNKSPTMTRWNNKCISPEHENFQKTEGSTLGGWNGAYSLYSACTKINFQRKLHLVVEIACIFGILSLHTLYSNDKKPPIIQIPECNKRSESRAFNKYIMLCS